MIWGLPILYLIVVNIETIFSNQNGRTHTSGTCLCTHCWMAPTSYGMAGKNLFVLNGCGETGTTYYVARLPLPVRPPAPSLSWIGTIVLVRVKPNKTYIYIYKYIFIKIALTATTTTTAAGGGGGSPRVYSHMLRIVWMQTHHFDVGSYSGPWVHHRRASDSILHDNVLFSGCSSVAISVRDTQWVEQVVGDSTEASNYEKGIFQMLLNFIQL